ncbi:hypothetical protein [Caulobacter sp. UNC279MFTsu5.1]|uniref:hypothetical protein n=1 Tax=Caulobacter sp. UNC279MFTsu5.1 TaxID=1502775 RepID=UPI00036AA631|nr:hypothetical protein [Caulobacter sp. UNC279MFTsu5.1]SFJ30193.1 hypothetical protein SAMN02799626_01492 [Caulobacter sp. UNC279MFTsu5.1]
MTDISNAIAASSMLLAVVAVLFGVWNGAIDAALALDVSGDPATQLPQRRQLRSAILTKASPLVIGAWLTAVVFLARSVEIGGRFLRCPPGQACRPDDVAAAFLLTEAFMLLIAAATSVQLIRLVARWLEARRRKTRS